MNQSLKYNNTVQQSGAVLIIALLLLIALTTLSLMTAHTSLTQEKMSANHLQYYIALQSAESALRRAKNLLQQFYPNFSDNINADDLDFDPYSCGKKLLPLSLNKKNATTWQILWNISNPTIDTTWIIKHWDTQTKYISSYAHSYLHPEEQSQNIIPSVGKYQPEFFIAFDCFDNFSLDKYPKIEEKKITAAKSSLFYIIAKGIAEDGHTNVFIESIYAIPNPVFTGKNTFKPITLSWRILFN